MIGKVECQLVYFKDSISAQAKSIDAVTWITLESFERNNELEAHTFIDGYAASAERAGYECFKHQPQWS